MAVPLVDKGVVVVAVDYDIAPKGTAYFFYFHLQRKPSVNIKSFLIIFQVTWI